MTNLQEMEQSPISDPRVGSADSVTDKRVPSCVERSWADEKVLGDTLHIGL